MGLFSKKKKNIEVLEMTPQDKESLMMTLARRLLSSPLYWSKYLEPDELSVLNDFEYCDIKYRMDEFDELYKNINELEELYGDNSFVDSLFKKANILLRDIMLYIPYEIQTLTDFKNVYDELIKPATKKFYNQMMCMKVLVDNDINQFYEHFSQLNNNGNTYNYLSEISEQVLNKYHNRTILLTQQDEIQQSLSVAYSHVEKIREEEERKKQERTNRLNDAFAKSFVDAIRKSEEIERMLEDNKKFYDDGISNNKTKQ